MSNALQFVRKFNGPMAVIYHCAFCGHIVRVPKGLRGKGRLYRRSEPPLTARPFTDPAESVAKVPPSIRKAIAENYRRKAERAERQAQLHGAGAHFDALQAEAVEYRRKVALYSA